MISYNEAITILFDAAARRTIDTEITPVSKALHRTTASALFANDKSPRFTNAVMDGYAVRAADTTSAKYAPCVFNIVGTIAAGETPGHYLQGLTSVEIMTGAAVPKEFDAVIPVENVSREGASITINRPVSLGEYVRYAGEDISVGDSLIGCGTRILPQHLLVLSMAGVSSVPVFKRPRVSVFSTGSELVSCDVGDLESYQIRNATEPMLAGVLERYGASVTCYGIVPDSKEAIAKVLSEILDTKPDIVISTGGVSAGAYDLVKPVVVQSGANELFHKVSVRPGKPVFCAAYNGGPLFFGLPGNPVAVAASARFFVYPYLRALTRAGEETFEMLPLSEKVKKPPELLFFQRGVRTVGGVAVLPGQGSAMVSSMLDAQGWIVGRTDGDVIEKNEMVGWYSLW